MWWPGGEAEDLGNDCGDGACRQAVARHSTCLAEQQTLGLEVDHVAGRDVVLLPVHNEEPPGEANGTRQRKWHERFSR